MTWTDEDTRALRYAAAGLSEYEPSPDGKLGTEHPTSGTLLVRRAAAHIEALEARVARFETEYECHPQGGVPGCDCWECLRTRIAELEAANHELRVLYEDGKLHASCNHPRFVNAASALECRADEIERLQARVAELEAAVAYQQERVRDEACAKVAGWLHAIPRAALVSALRERAAAWERRALAALTSPQASAEERLFFAALGINAAGIQRVECLTLADEIERGEWPKGPGND